MQGKEMLNLNISKSSHKSDKTHNRNAGMHATRSRWECRGTGGFFVPEKLTGFVPKPGVGSTPGFGRMELPLSNVERFIEVVTPTVAAKFLSKTAMRGPRTSNVEFQPYFMLSDLWDAFKEWSAYGAGVPLVMNGRDSVVQYYVPYLSGIQIYVDPSNSPLKSRQASEDNDGAHVSRHSSTVGSSKAGTNQGSLLFQYFEYDAPFYRIPLADKISDLALQNPVLNLLRSCDLLSSSWLSVSWYPICRIPTASSLKDMETSFLTYHSLYTPVGEDPAADAPVVIFDESDGIPCILLQVFGLASYRFRGSLWTPTSGSDLQLMNSLSQAADSWLRLLQVHHPDYLFFRRNR